jgi:CDP-diacylglycerol--glycerol-3-phosphate 3-phosphatidyltransferase
VSVFRILLVPIVVWLILADGDAAHYWAAGLFVIAASTDALDGYLARRHAMTTRTGAWLDPLSDKLLVGAPIVVLAAQGDFPWWAAVIIVGREIAVSLLRVYLGSRRASMPASVTGKVKAVLQMTAITLYLLPGVPEGVRLTVLVIAVVFTVWSGVEYFMKAGALARAER